MGVTDQVLEYMQGGGVLTEWQARDTFGVQDINRLLWNLRVRGNRVSETQVVTAGRERPRAYVEYRLTRTP